MPIIFSGELRVTRIFDGVVKTKSHNLFPRRRVPRADLSRQSEINNVRARHEVSRPNQYSSTHSSFAFACQYLNQGLGENRNVRKRLSHGSILRNVQPS